MCRPKMMARTLYFLIILLGSINVNNSEFGECDYFQQLEIGKSYDIFSPNYPLENYKPNTTCRWTAKSDRPIRITCNNFQLPESSGCITDVLMVETSMHSGEQYCGNRTFSLISQKNQLVIKLYSSLVSRGGRFLCAIQSINFTMNEMCRCGWENPTRIVGGYSTGVNEYPMMAALVDSILKILFCGATIINNQQVITAAHCVENKLLQIIGVLVGDHDTMIHSETDAAQLLQITHIIIHPQYSAASGNHDIALINIRGKILFNLQVGPACLPIQHSLDSFGGNLVDVIGWGSVGPGEKTSRILQKAQISVITNAECSRTYRDITSHQLCTFGQGKDTCQYDSGGPVLWKNPTTRRIILTSIIASGGICADGNPSINTKVGAYIDWILMHTPTGNKHRSDDKLPHMMKNIVRNKIEMNKLTDSSKQKKKVTNTNDQDKNFFVEYQGNCYEISDLLKYHPGGHHTLQAYKGLALDKVLSDVPHSVAAFHLFQEFKINNEGTYNDIEKLVNWTLPLFKQVGPLANHYWEWVNLPVNRPIRLFKSDLMEILTITPWYIVPVVWIPISIYFFVLGSDEIISNSIEKSPIYIILSFVCGLLHWSFLEYALHRKIFHLQPPPYSKTLIALHFLLHGLHHKSPFDSRRLVFPPIAGLCIAIVLYKLYQYIFPTSLLNIVTAGTIIGYLCYDMIHYYLHHGKPGTGTYLYNMKRYHNYHHFLHHEQGFGISFKLWDYLFNTLIILRQLKKAIIW